MQRQHRQEAQGDDEQRQEERRSDLDSRPLHQGPSVGGGQWLALDVLVQVLDHDDGRVHHGADRNGDPSEGHDVGADPLPLHEDEGGEDTDRQAEDHHQGRAHVPQEERADQADDDELLDQTACECVDGPVDESGAVVDRNQLHALGQSLPKLGQLLLDGRNGLQGVISRPHQDDAAHHLPLSVQLRDALAHLGSQAYVGDVAETIDRRGPSGASVD